MVYVLFSMTGIAIAFLAYMCWGKPNMKEYIRLLWYLGEPFPLRLEDKKIGVFSTSSDKNGNLVSTKPFYGFNVDLPGLRLENFSSNILIVMLEKVHFSWQGEHTPKFVLADSDQAFKYKFVQSYGRESVIMIFRLKEESFEIRVLSENLKSVTGKAYFSLSPGQFYRVDLKTPKVAKKVRERHLDLPWDYFNHNQWALVF